MQFVYPNFLYASFAALIPVIIHLFYFRKYKSIVFSDIRFLKNVEEASKSNRRIRDYIILFCRILTILFLVLAFARPFLPNNTASVNKADKYIALYLDNSFSMLNEGKEGLLLEEAKNKARAIVNGYGKDAHFTLITNIAFRNRWLTKSDMLQHIDEVKVTASQKNINEIQSHVDDAMSANQEAFKSVYLISDFQQNAFTNIKLKPDSIIQWNIIPVQFDGASNTYLDSAWITSPVVKLNQEVVIKLKVVNEGNLDKQNQTITLKVNGVQKGIRTVNLRPHETVEVAFNFVPTGNVWQQCELSTEDYPITFDDKLFLAFKAGNKNKVLCVNAKNENAFLNTLFNGDADFQYNKTTVNAIDYNSLATYDLIILNEVNDISSGLQLELEKFMKEGGQVFFIPTSEDLINNSVNQLMAQVHAPLVGKVQSNELKVEKLNLVDMFFRDVFTHVPSNPDYPKVKQYHQLQTTANTGGRMLMQLNNGDAFLWSNTVGKGKLVMISVPLNAGFSNFQQHALFVPVMLKLGLGLRRVLHPYYQIKSAMTFNLLPDDATKKLIRFTKGKLSISSEVKLRNGNPVCTVYDQFEQAGIYAYQFDAEKSNAGFVAVNYNANESEMKFADDKKLAGIFPKSNIIEDKPEHIQNLITTSIEGKALWRYRLWLAVFFIAAEILLLKFWK